MELSNQTNIVIAKKLRSSKKFEDWCKYFLDNSNKLTNGNKTQAAIKAYNLNPDKKYEVAASIGYQNFKKLQLLTTHVGSMLLEKEGIGFKELMLLGLDKVKSGTYKDWESFVFLLGYVSKDTPESANVQLNQVNFNLGEEIRKSRIARGLN